MIIIESIQIEWTLLLSEIQVLNDSILEFQMITSLKSFIKIYSVSHKNLGSILGSNVL